MNELREAALAYVRAGLLIFPLQERSKFPFAKPKPEEGKPGHFCAAPLHQHGFKDATADLVVIEAWWKAHPLANIGLATGHGLDVLDVDGQEGEATLAALIARRWPLPETCEVATSPGHRQLYFRTAGWPCSASGRLGPMLDTRGLGGYVLLPPDIHPSGAVYAWTNLSEPAAAPAWLTALLVRPEPVAVSFVPRVRSEDDDDVIEQASRFLEETAPAISKRGGHLATWEAARTLRGFGLTKDDALDLLRRIYNPRCSPPWREGELRHKINEAFSNRAKKIPEPPRDLTGRAS